MVTKMQPLLGIGSELEASDVALHLSILLKIRTSITAALVLTS